MCKGREVKVSARLFGEEKFDQVRKGYFLELAERKGRAFQVVDEGLVWRQEDIACLQRGHSGLVPGMVGSEASGPR